MQRKEDSRYCTQKEKQCIKLEIKKKRRVKAKVNLSLYIPRRHTGKYTCKLHALLTFHQMKSSSQLHDPAALLPYNEPLIRYMVETWVDLGAFLDTMKKKAKGNLSLYIPRRHTRKCTCKLHAFLTLYQMKSSCQLHDPAALLPYNGPLIRYMVETWVDLGAFLDTMKKRNIFV